jgi:hypothetical protein
VRYRNSFTGAEGEGVFKIHHEEPQREAPEGVQRNIAASGMGSDLGYQKDVAHSPRGTTRMGRDHPEKRSTEATYSAECARLMGFDSAKRISGIGHAGIPAVRECGGRASCRSQRRQSRRVLGSCGKRSTLDGRPRQFRFERVTGRGYRRGDCRRRFSVGPFRMMAGIRGKDRKPELLIRRAFRRGYRFGSTSQRFPVIDLALRNTTR